MTLNFKNYRYAHISSETTLDEYIDFDGETITSEPAVDPIQVDWRKECREKTLQRSCNKKMTDDDEIADNE